MKKHPWDNKLKYNAGLALRDLIDWSEPLGLGAGSTLQAAIKAIHDSDVYRGTPVACGSKETEEVAKHFGMNVVPIEQLPMLGYTCVDGTDQFDPNFHLIKGGFKNTGNPGQEGCMLREKELASGSGNFIVICDDTKKVPYLGYGGYKLPIEYDHRLKQTARKKINELFQAGNRDLESRHGPTAKTFETENRNRIYDVPFDSRSFDDLENLESELKHSPGIIETGLFAINRPNYIIVSGPDRIDILERQR